MRQRERKTKLLSWNPPTGPFISRQPKRAPLVFEGSLIIGGHLSSDVLIGREVQKTVKVGVSCKRTGPLCRSSEALVDGLWEADAVRLSLTRSRQVTVLLAAFICQKHPQGVDTQSGP